jgi:hypothetical protein
VPTMRRLLSRVAILVPILTFAVVTGIKWSLG